MDLVVDQGIPSSSKAMTRKQLVVGCILLSFNLLTVLVVLDLV